MCNCPVCLQMEVIARKRYSCSICSKYYSKNWILKKHMKQKHSDNPSSTYQCHICEKAFTEKANQRRNERVVHMRHKKHSCDLCDKSFTFKWHLDGHKRQHHDIGVKETCICGTKFGFHSSYVRHQRSCPSVPGNAVRRLECKICKVSFKNDQCLKVHKKYSHNQDRLSFVCQECGESCTRPWALTRHRRRKHTAETSVV